MNTLIRGSEVHQHIWIWLCWLLNCWNISVLVGKELFPWAPWRSPAAPAHHPGPHSPRPPEYLVITELMPSLWKGGLQNLDPALGQGPFWWVVSEPNSWLHILNFSSVGTSTHSPSPRGKRETEISEPVSPHRGQGTPTVVLIFWYLLLWHHKDTGSLFYREVSTGPGNSILGSWA